MIKETHNYTLSVGDVTTDEMRKGTQVYQVVNKEYGVVELESTSLTFALKLIDKMQADLEDTLNPSGQDDLDLFLEEMAGDHTVN